MSLYKLLYRRRHFSIYFEDFVWLTILIVLSLADYILNLFLIGQSAKNLFDLKENNSLQSLQLKTFHQLVVTILLSNTQR